MCSTDVDKTSTTFVSAIKYTSADEGDCIQIGGQIEQCAHLYSWPEEWTQDAVSGNTYSAVIDVTDANYTWPPGYYTVSFFYMQLYFIFEYR